MLAGKQVRIPIQLVDKIPEEFQEEFSKESQNKFRRQSQGEFSKKLSTNPRWNPAWIIWEISRKNLKTISKEILKETPEIFPE